MMNLPCAVADHFVKRMMLYVTIATQPAIEEYPSLDFLEEELSHHRHHRCGYPAA
jgi:hypothetical protein